MKINLNYSVVMSCIFICMLYSCDNRPIRHAKNKQKSSDDKTTLIDKRETDSKRTYILDQKSESDESVKYNVKVLTDTTRKTNKRRSKSFYQGLIDDFCKKYYDKKFQKLGYGPSYTPGSILVEIIRDQDENTLEIIGTHSYRYGITGILDPKKPEEFRATIRCYNNDKYQINFMRRGKNLNRWISTGTLPITYSKD